MKAYLLKDWKFMISTTFFVGLFVYSICYGVFFDDKIKLTLLEMNEKAEVLSVPPYSPLEKFPFGTDLLGYDMLQMVIVGAKYTLSVGLIIALLRVLMSLFIGSTVSTYFPRILTFMRWVSEPFSIVPQTLIAFFILFNVLWMKTTGFDHPFWERALFEILVLSFLALPTLSLQFTSQMRKLWNQEYIESAIILGGSKWHIFWKHIMPNMKDKIFFLFIQQFIQALIILAHLGTLKLFFGGTFIDYETGQPPKSISMEWSGIIGDSYRYLRAYPWIPLTPIIFFALSILSLSTILESLKKAFRLKDEGKI
ncbi:ABC transporter permease [Peribacillus acanthi]|uniref:ABC transporter permease n=1 Tax=Peribacillus acanthi TaxID=2171554 RepID=UPI000D3EC4C2|nr:ABC transporter permease subunit [Peribacillus acanthi]